MDLSQLFFLLINLLRLNRFLDVDYLADVICVDTNHQIKLDVNWGKEKQTITGFGVYAGRENLFYSDVNRDTIIDNLFGQQGLRLNIVRGAIHSNLHHYAPFYEDPSSVSCPLPYQKVQADSSLWKHPDVFRGEHVHAHHSPVPKLTEEQLDYVKLDEQFKLLKLIQQKYNPMIILSSWSPPYIWKRFPIKYGFDNRLPFNHLLKSHYNDFAQYLINYIKFYENNGLKVYAVSTQNEPEFPTKDWEGCFWLPNALADFNINFLRPSLDRQGLKVKIMGPENANPTYSRLYSKFGSKGNEHIGADIYVSHGYSTSLHPSFVTSIGKWGPDQYPKWVTEASDTRYKPGLTASIGEALLFATSLHKFLTVADINAYVFWLAMFNRETGEALVASLYKKNHMLDYSKHYYVFGQFTRYIRPGFKRIDMKLHAPHCSKTMSSFYVKQISESDAAMEFVLVLINPSKLTIEVQLDLNAFHLRFDEKTLSATKTDQTSNWQPLESGIFVESESLIQFEIGAQTVQTVTGTIVPK